MNITNNKKIIGYHGTKLCNFENIKKNNFKPSIGEQHYLGNGVYFFIDDFSENGKENAAKWAEKFGEEACVIEAHINLLVDKTLDLTTKEHLHVYNLTLEYFISEIKVNKSKKAVGLNKNRNISGKVINRIIKITNYKFIKAWTSSGFSYLKKKGFFTAIPNGCELCVIDVSYIIKNSIK